MKMDFYFDEAYHDKAITYRNNSLNLEKVEEFYVGCYIGSEYWDEIEEQVSKLEKDFKEKFHINMDVELKSTILIKSSKMSSGLASLFEDNLTSKRALYFYVKLFEILSNKVKIHFSVLNKYEYLLRVALPDESFFESQGIYYQPFLYSFTKFLVLHPDYNIPEILFTGKNTKHKIKELSDVFQTHIDKIKNIDKKHEELLMTKELNRIINFQGFYFNHLPDKLKWDYSFSAKLFKLYCKELSICPNHIYIDEEADTMKALKRVFSCEISGKKSNENIKIRICDWIVGFFTRMILSYDKDYKNDNENDLTENIHFLPDQFFRNDDEFKNFMSLLYDLFIVQQESYWATSGSIYTDQTICFYTFLRYYDICKRLNNEPNPTDFNLELSKELHNVFQNML